MEADRLDLVGSREGHVTPDPPAPHQDPFLVLRPSQPLDVLARGNDGPDDEQWHDDDGAPAERRCPDEADEEGKSERGLYGPPEGPRVNRLPGYRRPVEPRDDLLEKAGHHVQPNQRRQPFAIPVAARLGAFAADRKSVV